MTNAASARPEAAGTGNAAGVRTIDRETLNAMSELRRDYVLVLVKMGKWKIVEPEAKNDGGTS